MYYICKNYFMKLEVIIYKVAKQPVGYGLNVKIDANEDGKVTKKYYSCLHEFNSSVNCRTAIADLSKGWFGKFSHFSKDKQTEDASRFSFRYDDVESMKKDLAEMVEFFKFQRSIKPALMEIPDTDSYKIIKFEEKHGEYFYVVNTIEQVDRVFFKTLKERYDSGWFDWLNSIKEPVAPKRSMEKINELPEWASDLKETIERDVKQYERDLATYNEYKSLYQKIEDVVKGHKLREASEIIRSLSNSEYEGYEFITPEEID